MFFEIACEKSPELWSLASIIALPGFTCARFQFHFISLNIYSAFRQRQS